MNDLLPQEAVQKAWSREGIENTVLDLLERHASQLKDVSDKYRSIEDNSERQRYGRDNLGFFADAIEKAGDFKLGSLEIIAIWSKVIEMGLSMRYDVAGILGFGYATGEISNRSGAVRHFLETSNYRADLLADETQKEVISRRLADLHRAVSEIEFYRIGMRVTMREMVDDLRSPTSEGLLDQADENARKNPLTNQLGQLGENLGNGLMRVYQGLRMDLKNKPSINPL